MPKNKIIGVCRLCRREGAALVDAHVIPRSFFELVRGEGKFSVGFQVDKNSYSTPYFQAGPSDDSILGSCCEPKFSDWDAYGFKILGRHWRAEDAQHSEDGPPVAFELKNVDYESLALFILSVVWRASVSSIPLFKNVSLGPELAERIRQILLSREAPEPPEFSIVSCSSPGHKYRATILPPDRIRTPEGINFYRLYLPYLFILVKADWRAAPFPLNLVMLQRSAWNYVMCFPYGKSPWTMLERIPADIRTRRWVGKGKRNSPPSRPRS
jgi:hypothetical protein